MKCKHNWVKSGYGNDLICTKCGYAAMQAQATGNMVEPTTQPLLREEVSIPLYNSSETIIVPVYKDELEKALSRAIGLDIMQSGWNR